MPRARHAKYNFNSFGVHLWVHADGVPAAVWRRCLPPGAALLRRKRVRSARAYHLSKSGLQFQLRVDDGPLVSGLSQRAFCDLLEGDMALHVAASAPKYIFIHAGVVAWKGHAVLVPGRTMTGKSSLIEAMVSAGARYYSDEYAVIDATGRILPYPRRLSLRQVDGPPVRMVPRGSGRRPLYPGWVLGTRYEPDRVALEVTPISAGQTALLLLANAVAARLAPDRVLPSVRAVAGRALGANVIRGDAKKCAMSLLRNCTKRRDMIAKLAPERDL